MKKIITLASTLYLLTLVPYAIAADQDVKITVLSSRPDMVSGGDALVQVALPAGKPAVIKLNGQDVTSLFHRGTKEGGLIGLVTGLKDGENSLDVFSSSKPNGPAEAHVILKNHPISGPIFSGRQEEPFICMTQDFKLPDGKPLGPALDANCSVNTVVTYVYKSTATADTKTPDALNLKAMTNRSSLPPDVAWTTTSLGQKVPYIVRVETGTINRAIYQIAVLHDPTTGEPGPTAPPKAWNGRLIYSFGGGCIGGWYEQGKTLGVTNRGVISDATIGKGYAEASSSLNVAGNSCNDVLAAETMMMVKERFIKSFGKPLFTMSRGASGGSYQQNQIADNYPGLLDGIIPSLTFPDVQELTQMVTDSRLFKHYYAQADSSLTRKQQEAIAGVAEIENIEESDHNAGRINATEACPAGLPKEKRYDRVSNKSGTRCDIYDHNINSYGRDPETGYALRPVDNTGVQYGLDALNGGVITTAQFLDVNEKIGGYDSDGEVVATRSVADRVALRNAYQGGLITYGAGGLGKLPIIDVRPYRDKLPNGDNHLKYHSFALRERLQKANGTFANDVMLAGDMKNLDAINQYALEKMDEWLTKLLKDSSKDPVLDRILRAKPTDLVDSCWTTEGERIVEPQTISGGKCNELYPVFLGPRRVAGGPLSNNVLKCQLKAIDYHDYKAPFNDAEKARLSAIFPNGVCDWSKPGVEQQPPVGTWLSH